MTVIDFRVRPPYKNYLKFFSQPQFLGKLATDIGLTYAESIKEQSKEIFLQEFEEAGIDLAIIPGRGLIEVDNNELFEFANQHPGKFIIFPFVDPLEGEAALKVVDDLVINGDGKGISIEPGYQQNLFEFNDERAFPLYEKLEKHDIPLLITYSALSVPYIDNNTPYYLDQVATKFPNLKIIVAHGGWPWVRETIAIAFKNRNVYLIPDIYGINVPGAQDYIDAANTILQDQIIYGSSYPLAPLKDSLEHYQNAGLREDVQQKVFYENAAKLLGLKKEVEV